MPVPLSLTLVAAGLLGSEAFESQQATPAADADAAFDAADAAS